MMDELTVIRKRGKSPVLPQVLQQTLDMWYNTGENVRQTAKMLGIARATVRNHVAKALAMGLVPNKTEISEEPKEISPVPEAWAKEKFRLESRIRDLEAQLKTAWKEDLHAEEVRKRILCISEASPDPPKWLLEPPGRKDNPGTPVMAWGDWHWGETVDEAEMDGLNVYNTGVAHERVRTLVKKMEDLCFNHLSGATYDGLVVPLLGDMLSGDIHEELTETNSAPMMPVLLDLLGVMIWAFEELLTKFDKIFVPCVAGNHPRTSRKPRHKTRAQTNYDWLLGSLLERHFQKEKQIQFLVPTTPDVRFKVHNHVYQITHGDLLGTKGGDGIIGAIGPIIRGDHKMRSVSTFIQAQYDTLLIGHWHSYLPLPKVIVNGTLRGYDQYARDNRMAPEPPSQALHFAHPKYGISWQLCLHVDEADSERGKMLRPWLD